MNCAACGANDFHEFDGEYGLIKLDDTTFSSEGFFQNQAKVIGAKVFACKNCDHLQMQYAKDKVREIKDRKNQ